MADDLLYHIAGFCDEPSSWADCGPFGTTDVALDDDEIYRKFLRVRRYQLLALWDLDSLTEAIRIFWGETAMVLNANHRRVVIAPGRPLSQVETSLLQLYPRVLPVAPGVQIRFHLGAVNVFGFGEGWGYFCQPSPDPALAAGGALINEFGIDLVTEAGQPITTGPITEDAEWMCELDVSPYDCAA